MPNSCLVEVTIDAAGALTSKRVSKLTWRGCVHCLKSIWCHGILPCWSRHTRLHAGWRKTPPPLPIMKLHLALQSWLWLRGFMNRWAIIIIKYSPPPPFLICAMIHPLLLLGGQCPPYPFLICALILPSLRSLNSTFKKSYSANLMRLRTLQGPTLQSPCLLQSKLQSIYSHNAHFEICHEFKGKD